MRCRGKHVAMSMQITVAHAYLTSWHPAILMKNNLEGMLPVSTRCMIPDHIEGISSAKEAPYPRVPA